MFNPTDVFYMDKIVVGAAAANVIEIAHRRIMPVSLRRLTDAAPQGAGPIGHGPGPLSVRPDLVCGFGDGQ
jgi:hypothetical protein